MERGTDTSVDGHIDLMGPWACQATDDRRVTDWARMGGRFAPILEARDWPTIQREVP